MRQLAWMVEGRNQSVGFELSWLLGKLREMNPYVKGSFRLARYDPYRSGDDGTPKIRTTDQLRVVLASGRFKANGSHKP